MKLARASPFSTALLRSSPMPTTEIGSDFSISATAPSFCLGGPSASRPRPPNAIVTCLKVGDCLVAPIRFAPAYLHQELAPSTLDGVDVTFEVSGDLLALPEGPATTLAEKLRLFAAGEFSHEVRKLEKLGTSRAWLAGTREAADRIEMALVDERSGPVRLVRGNVADAVFQVMRLSHVDTSERAGAAGLTEALEALSEPGG